MYEPDFVIGQKVWMANVTRTPIWLECPDCKGSKIWIAETANGEKVSIRCPRCDSGGVIRDRRFPELRVIKVETDVTEMTISEVRLDRMTADGASFDYMCAETSHNGSGSVYHQGGLVDRYNSDKVEHRGLYNEWDHAMKAAALMAAEQQDYENQRTAAEIIKESSTLPLKVAMKEYWWSTVYDGWVAAGERKSMLQEIMEKVTLSDEMIMNIDDVIQDKPWRKRGALDRLIEAAEAIVEGESGTGAESGWIELKELKDALANITPKDEVVDGPG